MDYTGLLDKLKRLMPPPPPASGWGLVRLMAGAQALGPMADTHQAEAEANLLLGARNQRTDTAPTDWTGDAHTWMFRAALEPTGAAGFYLDTWGRFLGVPREAGEPDGLYAPRILAERLRPTVTNLGMANAIDQGVGIQGTRVLEASDVLQLLRLNTPGLRINNAANQRLNMAGNFQGDTLNACFVVQVPTGAQQPYTQDAIGRIADRAKAAGTRLVGIFSSDAGAIIAPDYLTVGQSATAFVNPEYGAIYAWSLTGGVIDSGQGMNQITFHGSVPGRMDLSLSVTTTSGLKTYWKPIQVYVGVALPIDTALYQYAGTFQSVASIPVAGNEASITWSAMGLDLRGPVDQPIVTFDVGVAGTLAQLTVQVKNGAGATGTSTVQIKVVPYTSQAQAVTVALPTGQIENLQVDLGWEYSPSRVDVDRPAWVRIYNTAAARDADAMRTITQEPDPNLTDLVWEGVYRTIRSIQVAPGVKGVNGDSPRAQTAYLSVTNLDTVTAPVTVTVTRTETRTSGTF